MVQWIEHALPMLESGFDSRSGYAEHLKNGTCGLSSLVLVVEEWVQREGSRAALPLTSRQCCIQKKQRGPRLKHSKEAAWTTTQAFERSSVDHDSSKRRWAPHSRYAPEGAHNVRNETEQLKLQEWCNMQLSWIKKSNTFFKVTVIWGRKRRKRRRWEIFAWNA